MKFPTIHRFLVRLAGLFLCLASLGSSLGGCDHDRLAGTSVGTGNPGLVTLGFQEGSTAARVRGRVALFAADHNPLVDSLPLAAFAVEDEDSLVLPLESLPPSRRGPGSTPDSLLLVNVLLQTADGRGAWLPGVALAPRPGGRPSGLPRPRIDLMVVPLDTIRGMVGSDDVEGERRYLTLFGSPFFGRITGREFGLLSVPRGRYEARLVRFLEDAPMIGNIKESPVHALGDSLDTRGIGTLTPSTDILGTVPLPVEGPRERP